MATDLISGGSTWFALLKTIISNLTASFEKKRFMRKSL